MVIVPSEMLGLFVNNLAADDKYSRLNRENLQRQILMQLSQKLQRFCQFFIGFRKSKSTSEYFQQKNESHSLSITEITDSESGGYLNVQNVVFHRTLRQSTC